MIKTYGPYTRSDGRMHIIEYDTLTQKRTTISYPKWLVLEAGIEIPEGYEVHHKDEDFTNNSLDNLEVKLKSKHNSEHSKGTPMYEFECPVCGQESEVEFRVYKRNQLTLGKAGPYCSKSCAGKIHH